MKYFKHFGAGMFALTLTLASLSSTPLYAHGTNNDGHTPSNTMSDADVARLTTLLSLLEQLVALLVELKAHAPDTAPIVVSVPTGEADDAMIEHHTDHGAHDAATSTDSIEDATEATPKLIIELEEHHDETHVHVRYVEKPEDMFFITAHIDDEEGIIREIGAKTGISVDDIRAALVYF